MQARWMRSAERDRADLFDFIERRSIEGAIATDEEIRRVANLLIDFPRLGHKGRVRGTLEFNVTQQIVLVYRIRPQLKIVEFLRLIHTRRDLS